MDQSEYGRIRNLVNDNCQGVTVEAGVPARPTTGSTQTTVPTATTTTFAPTGETTVVIAYIVYDAPGSDVEYNNSEYVILNNASSSTVDVGRRQGPFDHDPIRLQHSNWGNPEDLHRTR